MCFLKADVCLIQVCFAETEYMLATKAGFTVLFNLICRALYQVFTHFLCPNFKWEHIWFGFLSNLAIENVYYNVYLED